jgi:hypothetical protein
VKYAWLDLRGPAFIVLSYHRATFDDAVLPDGALSTPSWRSARYSATRPPPPEPAAVQAQNGRLSIHSGPVQPDWGAAIGYDAAASSGCIVIGWG